MTLHFRINTEQNIDVHVKLLSAFTKTFFVPRHCLRKACQFGILLQIIDYVFVILKIAVMQTKYISSLLVQWTWNCSILHNYTLNLWKKRMLVHRAHTFAFLWQTPSHISHQSIFQTLHSKLDNICHKDCLLLYNSNTHFHKMHEHTWPSQDWHCVSE